MEETKKCIARILHDHPDICDAGLVTPDLIAEHKSDYDAFISQEQSRLIKQHREFGYCCEWLSYQNKTKSINTKSNGSYTLKHRVENWGHNTGKFNTHISNGILIIAAIHLGFKVKKHSKNASFNISSRLNENHTQKVF